MAAMSGPNLRQQLAEAQATIRALMDELTETNRGLLALTAELEAKNEETASMSQQLLQTAKLATMGELVASIAHELNNPLAIIRLRIESLCMHLAEDDPQHKAMCIIVNETERMGTLVAQLLQFGRRSQPQVTTVDLCKEIDATLELIHYHFRNHNIAVERHYASEAPMILADRQQMQQVFLNLFNNASDAMPRGGILGIHVRELTSGPPAITVDAQPDQKIAQSGIEILVQDTGTGIEPDNMPKVLEAFFTTKPPGKGTGLGLSICRRTVEDFGGQMTLSSEIGKGTTVRILFPIPQVSSSAGKTSLRWE
ncbi:MAG: sensor histidine kinase [Armatimonadota bacterium]